MQVKTHISPVKKEDSNKGSCGAIANYLDKEEGQFFSHTNEGIEVGKAIEIIDNHSKGRLGKDESKWYSPMYSFSNDECRHITKILFGKNYDNYNDLSVEQRKIYNAYFMHLARRFQDAMAKNFNKEDLGIYDGNDLVYVGKVENQRKYKGDDFEVRNRTAKAGEQKPGFNTHIHIIQSRKAGNEKQSKISPEAKYKSRSHDNFNSNSRGGFDRTAFYNLVEEIFDNTTKYNRDLKDTFNYRNEVKNGNSAQSKHQNEENEQDYIASSTKPVKMEKKKFYNKEEIDQIVNGSSLSSYFLSLADRGILKYEGQSGGNLVFNDLNQETGSIHVNEKKGWIDFKSDEKGKIINAVMKYEDLSWKDSIAYLAEKNGFTNYKFENQGIGEADKNSKNIRPTSNTNILNVEPLKDSNITNYFLTRGISKDIIEKYLSKVTYERDGKKYYAGGMENKSGGFNVRTQYFKGAVGNTDITVIPGNERSKQALIFEGMMDYLSYLELNNKTSVDDRVIILNSTSNIKKALTELQEQEIHTVYCCVDADDGGDRFMANLRNSYKGTVYDIRNEYDLQPDIDLNDRLIISQISNVSGKSFKQ